MGITNLSNIPLDYLSKDQFEILMNILVNYSYFVYNYTLFYIVMLFSIIFVVVVGFFPLLFFLVIPLLILLFASF